MRKSEIRRDYIHDRAILIAPGRKKRPHHFITPPGRPSARKKRCPFCPEQVDKVKALYTIGPQKKNWHLKVIKNIYPAVSPNFPKAYGFQEIVIETPKHNVELAELPIKRIVEIIKVYQARIRLLSRNKRINYILIFKNNGGRAGASLEHAHSQIFASEFVPPHIINKLSNAQKFRIMKGECYYCRLIKKEYRGARWIVDDKYMAVFTPYAPSYGYEAWILPKRHVDNVSELTNQECFSMAKYLKKIISKLNQYELPYNFYLQQTIKDKTEHLYLRICPRRSIWAGLELGSRLIVNTVAPEEAAKFYKNR